MIVSEMVSKSGFLHFILTFWGENFMKEEGMK